LFPSHLLRLSQESAQCSRHAYLRLSQESAPSAFKFCSYAAPGKLPWQASDPSVDNRFALDPVSDPTRVGVPGIDVVEQKDARIEIK